MTKKSSKLEPVVKTASEEVVETQTSKIVEETPVKKEYIGGKEILKTEKVSEKLKKITDVEGTTYLEPIE